MDHVAGQALACVMVVRIDPLALIDGEAWMPPILHDFHQAGRDLFPCQERLDEFVAEQLHNLDRIGARDGDKRAIRGNQAIGDQTVKMRVKPGGIISVALQGRDHPREGAAILGGILE